MNLKFMSVKLAAKKALRAGKWSRDKWLENGTPSLLHKGPNRQRFVKLHGKALVAVAS